MKNQQTILFQGTFAYQGITISENKGSKSNQKISHSVTLPNPVFPAAIPLLPLRCRLTLYRPYSNAFYKIFLQEGVYQKNRQKSERKLGRLQCFYI